MIRTTTRLLIYKLSILVDQQLVLQLTMIRSVVICFLLIGYAWSASYHSGWLEQEWNQFKVRNMMLFSGGLF